jgi:NitT/TauT family transport system permease protein
MPAPILTHAIKGQAMTPFITHSKTQSPITRWQNWLPLIVFVIFIAVWEIAVRVGDYPAFILPTPERVARKFLDVIADGSLARHMAVTLLEISGGLGLGFLIATALGYVLAKSLPIERALSPYLVASQAVPIVAIAPLLVIWFGGGIASKVLVCALIVFFPILINTIAGLRGVSPDLHDLMRTLEATRWQTFLKLEAPAALPVLLAGLKIGATLSVIGAVVGEFAGAKAGLGVLISIADGQYDTARMFVGVFALIALALALYGAVSLIERVALRWNR